MQGMRALLLIGCFVIAALSARIDVTPLNTHQWIHATYSNLTIQSGDTIVFSFNFPDVISSVPPQDFVDCNLTSAAEVASTTDGVPGLFNTTVGEGVYYILNNYEACTRGLQKFVLTVLPAANNTPDDGNSTANSTDPTNSTSTTYEITCNAPVWTNTWYADVTGQIGDTLYFVFSDNSDVWLFSDKDAYDNCNESAATQLANVSAGSFEYELTQATTYYFASLVSNNNASGCANGQKFTVTVQDSNSTAPEPSGDAPGVAPGSEPEPSGSEPGVAPEPSGDAPGVAPGSEPEPSGNAPEVAPGPQASETSKVAVTLSTLFVILVLIFA